jgi:hypothetical protein
MIDGKIRGVPESSQTAAVTESVKEDERGGQGHTLASLLHQSAMLHCAVNTHCFYECFFFDFMFRSVCNGWQN